MTIETFMPEARAAAAQCWCDDTTSHLVMEPALAEVVAHRIAAWMGTAAAYARNVEFYQGLLDKCAEHLGPAAFTADDGSVCDTPLRLKIPELVAAKAKAAEVKAEEPKP